MAGFMVVLRDSLADLSGRRSNNRIEICIVVRIAREHLDSERPLFNLRRVAGQRMLHHIPQHTRIASAVFEQRIRQQPL